MKIVIIDSIVINEEQLSVVKGLGEVIKYNTTPKNRQEILNRGKDADIIISGWTDFDADVLQNLNKTQLISLWSTGYDQIDLEAARENCITVTNVRGYAKNAVAELAVGLMLAVLRKITIADKDVRINKLYDWNPFGGRELTGKTIGIIGLGAIGQKVARIAKGFDMNILAHSPQIDEALYKSLEVIPVTLEDLLRKSDIVTLHLPLLPETKHLISADAFNIMKETAIIINTTRYGLIDQNDLCEALLTKKISGAGLDDIMLNTRSAEMLMTMENVVLTPHIGFNTEEATIVKTNSCIENVMCYVEKKPINVL